MTALTEINQESYFLKAIFLGKTNGLFTGAWERVNIFSEIHLEYIASLWQF